MVIVSPLPTARGPLLVACNTDVNAAPCATGLGDLVLETDKSLPSRWIVKFTNPVLLVESGSALVALMEAVFVAAIPAGGTTVLSGAVAEIVMLSVAPTGRVAREQVTVKDATEQDQLVPLAAMLVKPVGRVSVTDTVLAASGPALRGRRLKVAALLAIIGFGEAVLVILRSPPVETLTVAVAVLLFGNPSGTPADSVAASVMLPLLELCTRPAIVSVLALPFGRDAGLLQLTVEPDAEQDHPLPDDETYVTFGGSVLTMLRAEDESGPRLLAFSVYVTRPPATTVLGDPLAVSTRSAPALTVVIWVTLLAVSPRLVEVATAVLLNVLPPAAVTVITMSTVLVAPLGSLPASGSVPNEHVTV